MASQQAGSETPILSGKKSLADAVMERPGSTCTEESVEMLVTLPLTRPEHSFLIIIAGTVAINGFLTELEYSVFPAATKHNANLSEAVLDWLGFDWVVIWFPEAHREIVEAVAEKWDLKFGLPRAVPHVKPFPAAWAHPVPFPIHPGKNVYTAISTATPTEERDALFEARIAQIRLTWANRLPLVGVRVLEQDDAVITEERTCTVCGEPFLAGTIAARIGERDVATNVHLSHIESPLEQSVALSLLPDKNEVPSEEITNGK